MTLRGKKESTRPFKDTPDSHFIDETEKKLVVFQKKDDLTEDERKEIANLYTEMYLRYYGLPGRSENINRTANALIKLIRKHKIKPPSLWRKLK